MLDAPVIGYRGFKWDGNGPLRAAWANAEWPITREPQRAQCIAPGGKVSHHHKAPHEGCTCGIHAYSDPNSYRQPVGAVVIGYGDLIVHPDGWRAELAELVALVIEDRPSGVGALNLSALSLLAEQYGVRVLDNWDHATALAKEQGGEPVPKILQAEAEAWHMGSDWNDRLIPFCGRAPGVGELERRLRKLFPWIGRGMVGRIDSQVQPYLPAFYYFSSSAAAEPMVSYATRHVVSVEIQAPGGERIQVEVVL